ncbi:MAG: hypothetical protein M3Z54_15135 [Gemmatimonadota bacterium]|nr:hypothetical protein [Gemmatimonadota bacterium]
MGPKGNAATDIASADTTLKSIDQSLNVLVRLKIKELQTGRSNNEMILLLHSIGVRPVDIARWLGKTPNDVNPVISRARKGARVQATGSEDE